MLYNTSVCDCPSWRLREVKRAGSAHLTSLPPPTSSTQTYPKQPSSLVKLFVWFFSFHLLKVLLGSPRYKYILPPRRGFPSNSAGKESACNAGDPSSIPGSGRFATERIGYLLQYSVSGQNKEEKGFHYFLFSLFSDCFCVTCTELWNFTCRKLSTGNRILTVLKNSSVLCLVVSHVQLFVTPWTVAHQAPLSMGILQARILEWVAMPSSRGSSQPRNQNTDLLHYRRILYCLSH